MRALVRQCWTGLRLLLLFTVVLGLLYPFAVLTVGRAVLSRADGSLVDGPNGTVVGSGLLGQSFSGPQWFLPRPPAAGHDYDPLASGASNLGPNNAALLATVEQRRAAVAVREGVDPARVPPDAVTASGSGLDPDVSPAYARLQVPRVARARGLPEAQVAALVERHVVGRQLGFLGEPRVNVLELNLALAEVASPAGRGDGRD